MKSVRVFAALFALVSAAHAQIALDQMDTFQDGTVMGWGGGGSPINLANGGPLGAGDHCLYVDTVSHSNLAVSNDVQWTGSWTAAGVKVVEMDLRNLGAVVLSMRLVLFGPGGTRWTSTAAVPLTVDSDWHHLYFPITEPYMTRVLGSATYSSTAAAVTSFVIRHQAGAPAQGGTAVSSAVRFDNIRAAAFASLPPVSFSMFRGSALSGGLSDMLQSDDSRLILRPGAVFSSGEAPVQCDVVSACPFTPSELRFSLEAHGSAPGMTQQILLYNYATSTFDSMGTVSATLTDSTTEATVSGASVSNYINGTTREVIARIAYRTTSAVFSFPWLARIDRVFWKAIP
jgi:hypothetical protein